LKLKSKILIIAGSDSSGGAGIQADIKTVTALGGYAMTAVTAVTAQNTNGVDAIASIKPEIIKKQILFTCKDIKPNVIKIGMLHSSKVIKFVAEALKKIKTTKIILDPVMVAKGGAKLINKSAIKTLKKKLIKNVYLITPNIPEAEVLTQMKIKNFKDMVRAGNILLKYGVKNVLLKGGHRKSKNIEDILVNKKEIIIFKNKKIKTKNTHGTGCTLSSAIATFLSCGKPLKKSCELGIKYVNQAIRSNPNYGKGHGPINHLNSIIINKKYR
jgi:hydroxymethylpyrimidine/phosphomethylpyrimidine kinase